MIVPSLATMAINYSQDFRRIKNFVFWECLMLSFLVVTNSRRQEYVFWVSRRLAGTYAIYRVLRFIADSFTKRGED